MRGLAQLGTAKQSACGQKRGSLAATEWHHACSTAGMLSPSRTAFVFLATLLAGCSDSTVKNGSSSQPDAEADAPVVTPDAEAVPDAEVDALANQAAGDASTCVCTEVGDAGVFVTSTDCLCRSPNTCKDYASTVAALCSNSVVSGLEVSSFTGAA